MAFVIKLLIFACLLAAEFGSERGLTAHGQLILSTTKFHSFATLDLAAGLSKYIQHETKRLEVIKNARGWEKEVPVVKLRLEKLKFLNKEFAAQKAEYSRLVKNVSDFHPTTALRLVSDFLDTWDSKLQNDTLYGFRFAEFLSNDDDTRLPREADMQLAAQAVVEIQFIYNLSTADVYAGDILGHMGTALRPRDAYQVAVAAQKLQHFNEAALWFETALNHTPKENFTYEAVQNASYPIAKALASLGLLKYGMDKKSEGVELIEKASALAPENKEIHRQYLKYRSGREVAPLVPTTLPDFSKHWFHLCAHANESSDVVKRLKRYHVCRYRPSSVVPYRQYREEVLSRTPFLSLLHDFLSVPEAQRLINVSASKLQNGQFLDGVGANLFMAEGAVLNHSVAEARHLSDRISDITGLDTEEKPLSGSGEPLHVMNYGLSGAFLPHYDVYRKYDMKYTMRNSGHRMASVLVYLSDVTAGGATAFPFLNITVKPRAGKALLWYNTNPGGEVEKNILHAGCTVAVGAKWVASKGVWSVGNELRRPCGPLQTSSHTAVDKMVLPLLPRSANRTRT